MRRKNKSYKFRRALWHGNQRLEAKSRRDKRRSPEILRRIFQKFQRPERLYRKNEKIRAGKRLDGNTFRPAPIFSGDKLRPVWSIFKKKRNEWRLICPFQGTSADFIKLAMVRMDKKLEDAGLKEWRANAPSNSRRVII